MASFIVKTARLKILGDSSILQNVYVWITHLDPLQFTEPRASSMSYYCGLPMVQYSRAIQEKKKKKSRGYSSFTVVYCATLHSIEFLWTLSGIVRKRFAPHCFLMRHAVSAAQLAKLHIWYITYISVHRKIKKTQ